MGLFFLSVDTKPHREENMYFISALFILMLVLHPESKLNNDNIGILYLDCDNSNYNRQTI